MSNPRTSPTDPPSASQLNAERAIRFHQDGDALLTVDAARAWLSRTGLALYRPRPDQLPTPAPSFVEATIGSANPEPTPEQMKQAGDILARLIAEGACVPLNLLGTPGAGASDTPDFVCSAAVFSFVFTLRGNKAWKSAPLTTGPVKVSPLALNAYEQVAAKLTLSAYDLTTLLGKEVTETAVLRALAELWQQLRVIPVPQADGAPALWELSTARFTKQIKAGANAGQPTALSALISLYLNQAVAATEDEVETFLSPLAPRSRLRSVIHDLTAARQLETIVVDGKTLVHIAGDLPSFTGKLPAASESTEAAQEASASEPGVAQAEDGGNIRKFTPDPAAKLGTGLRTRPESANSGAKGKPAFGKRPGFGGKPAYAKPASDRERRHFDRDGRPARPSFSKPWEEGRRSFPAQPASGNAQSSEGQSDGIAASSESAPFRERSSFRPRSASGGRPPFADRAERPRREFGGDAVSRPSRPGGSDRKPRPAFGIRPAFPAREQGDNLGEQAPRRTFSKPGTFGRKREGGESARAEGRPPRRAFSDGAAPGDRPGAGGFKRSGGATTRPERAPDRFSGGPREGSYAPRPPRGERPERAGGYAQGRPSAPRAGGDRPSFRGKPAFGARPGAPRRGGAAAEDGSAAPPRTFRKFDAPRGPKPFGAKRSADGVRPGNASGFARPSGERRPGPGGAGRPGSFAGKGGPFAKFAGGKKPFSKAGKPGGFAPTKRKQPEDEA